MRFWIITVLALALPAVLALSARSPEIAFERITLDLGISETCAIADFNNDGRPDVFSGDAWYEAPTWKRHVVRHTKEYGTYLASLSDLPLDVDKDGKVDIVSSSWHEKKLWWSRNTGKPDALWEDHVIREGYSVEFSFLVDLDNDGKANEILPQFSGPLTAWYEAKGGTLVEHPVSARDYGHGIGAGDINRDGRTDIITPKGWLEAPTDPRQPNWQFHQDFDLGSPSFIFVIDLNEDGLSDLLTANGHDYGIYWMEQRPDRTWVKHIIDDSWSQPHALTLADINGDGRMELITGKRFMAHDGHDPGEREPLGIYWYEYHLAENRKSVEWSRHLVEYGGRAGGGMHIPVVDMDRDGAPDFAVGGKGGLFLFQNLSRRKRP